jgi:hypothetical protein
MYLADRDCDGLGLHHKAAIGIQLIHMSPQLLRHKQEGLQGLDNGCCKSACVLTCVQLAGRSQLILWLCHSSTTNVKACKNILVCAV